MKRSLTTWIILLVILASAGVANAGYIMFCGSIVPWKDGSTCPACAFWCDAQGNPVTPGSCAPQYSAPAPVYTAPAPIYRAPAPTYYMQALPAPAYYFEQPQEDCNPNALGALFSWIFGNNGRQRNDYRANNGGGRNDYRANNYGNQNFGGSYNYNDAALRQQRQDLQAKLNVNSARRSLNEALAAQNARRRYGY